MSAGSSHLRRQTVCFQAVVVSNDVTDGSRQAESSDKQLVPDYALHAYRRRTQKFMNATQNLWIGYLTAVEDG